MKNNEGEYIQKIREWQSKQYLPGAFLGGNLPPMYFNRSKAVGYFLLLSGLLFTLGGLFSMVIPEVLERLTGLLPVTIGVLQLIGGIRILRNATS